MIVAGIASLAGGKDGWRVAFLVLGIPAAVFGVIAFRPEASLLYINAEGVMETVLSHIHGRPDVKAVVCGLSSSPFIDMAGAKMLHDLHAELGSRGIAFQIVGARGQVRDVLQAEGMADKTDSANWTRRMDAVLGEMKPASAIH